MRMAGKAGVGTNGGPNGDIYIEFKVANHEIFTREGRDVYVTIPLTVAEATLGCKKKFQQYKEQLFLKSLLVAKMVINLNLEEKA